jgi:hypothetical protein
VSPLIPSKPTVTLSCSLFLLWIQTEALNHVTNATSLLSNPNSIGAMSALVESELTEITIARVNLNMNPEASETLTIALLHAVIISLSDTTGLHPGYVTFLAFQ